MRLGSIGLLAIIPLAAMTVNLLPTQTVDAATHHHHKTHNKQCAAGGHSIAAVVSHNKALSDLDGDIKKAGLECTLSCGGPYTFFAPDNEAYGKWVKGDQNYSKDPKVLAKVLKYHVVKGKFTAADLANKRALPTLEGENLMVNAKDGKVMVDGAMVTHPDIQTSNGIIHVIDNVNIPERGK